MWNRALVEGLRHGGRIGRVLPLYLCGLLLGLVQVWPLGLAALNGQLRTTFLDKLVTGGVDALGDLFISAPTTATSAGVWALLTLPLTLLFSLAYNFFSGGMLSASLGTRPFWAGCRSTFWSFTALGLLLVILALIISIGVGVVGGLLSLGTTVTAVTIAVLLQLLNLVGEYARAIAVARDRRNPFVLFGAAFAFCVRHLGGVLAMGVLGIFLTIAVVALYFFTNNLLIDTPVSIAIQQTCIFLWVWVKYVRLLWALFYVRAVDQRARRAAVDPAFQPFEDVQVLH